MHKLFSSLGPCVIITDSLLIFLMAKAIWLCYDDFFVLFILFSKKCFLELTHVFTFALDFVSATVFEQFLAIPKYRHFP